MCLGLFDERIKHIWNKKAKEDGLRSIEGQIVLNSLSCKLLKLFRKKIWLPRCERTIAWEKTQNINFRLKRRKEEGTKEERSRAHRNRSSSSSPERQDSSCRSSSIEASLISKSTPTRHYEDRTRTLGNRVKEIVWDWVKEGKKWLGF